MIPIREDLIWASGMLLCANPPVVQYRDGFGAVLRNGAGDYTITLDRAINMLIGAGAIEGIVLTSAFSTGVMQVINVVPLTTATIQLLSFDNAGAALETGRMYFVVLKVIADAS